MPELLLQFNLGWGRTEGDGNVADVLQQGMLPVQSPDECSNTNRPLGRVDEATMVCGGSGQANQPGGCQGDSGGPLVCEEGGKWVLRGAVSWGEGRCTLNSLLYLPVSVPSGTGSMRRFQAMISNRVLFTRSLHKQCDLVTICSSKHMETYGNTERSY